MSEVCKNDAIEELENGIKNTIVLETIRRMQCNMDVYKDKMLKVCVLLNEKYGIGVDGIHRILDNVSDNYVFFLMHQGGEYAQWVQLGINCQRYADKKQVYVIQHYDEFKK